MYSTKQYEVPGANPFTLYAMNGPAGVSGSGYPAPQFDLGTSLPSGDAGGEFVLCKVVLGSTTTLNEGDVYVVDSEFTATLVTTSNSPRGAPVYVGRVAQANAAAGTYYLWLQRAGMCPVRLAAGQNANVPMETTTTGGQVNAPSSATVGTKKILGAFLPNGPTTFTATTVNGSAVLTGAPLSGVNSLANVAVGAGVSGTGIPGSTTVTAVDRNKGTVTLSANCTANGSGVTVTTAGVLIANLQWPYIDTTN